MRLKCKKIIIEFKTYLRIIVKNNIYYLPPNKNIFSNDFLE